MQQVTALHPPQSLQMKLSSQYGLPTLQLQQPSSSVQMAEQGFTSYVTSVCLPDGTDSISFWAVSELCTVITYWLCGYRCCVLHIRHFTDLPWTIFLYRPPQCLVNAVHLREGSGRKQTNNQHKMTTVVSGGLPLWFWYQTSSRCVVHAFG